MQSMSNKVKNMRSLLLILFSAISLSVSAQTITVTGNVKDTNGEPIIGASVVEKGNTANGTITDLDGNFSIKVDGKKDACDFIYWYENTRNCYSRKKIC